jgi:hypothetical protein
LGFTDEDAYNKWDTADDPRASYTIDFLIATLPEPLAPSLRYKFDTYLDAIQRAAEASDLIFDRLDLPWGYPSKDDSPGFRLGQEIDLGWEPNIGGESSAFASLKPSTKKQATSHDEAGILLFRSRAAGDHRLLLVFVVGETPTWGVRKQALTDSLNWMEWLSNLCDEPSHPLRFPRRADMGPLKIKIAGPSFTGSVESIHLALEGWIASHPELKPQPQITVISGAASAIGNTTRLHFGHMLQATTIPLVDRVKSTNEYLSGLGAQCDRIAILSETGTLFGRSVEKPDIEKKNPEVTTTTVKPADGTSDQKQVCAPLVLKFPLHISNLRRALRSTAGSPMPQLELGHRNLSFSEEQSEAGGYTVPAFSLRATSYDELTLTKLLQTIYRQRMDYVQIAATDVEDLIFLAQQIRIYCPDTVLVTSTADLRFLHTDVNPDLRGMLVFSTYPLFLPNQSWTYPFSARRSSRSFRARGSSRSFRATMPKESTTPFLCYWDTRIRCWSIATPSRRHHASLRYG